MKSVTATALVAVALSAVAFAGPQPVSMGKETKQIVETPCFAEHEFQLDIFGQYSVGEGPSGVGLFRDHGWGGGIGLNYFFSRNIGIGVDAAWLDAKEASFGRTTSDDGDDSTTIHNFSGSLIFRMPIDTMCLAPYVYLGGGCAVDGEQWATVHGGAGVEYRIVPQKVGVFLDGRWTYLGDRFGHDDLNFFSTRLGVRFVF